MVAWKITAASHHLKYFIPVPVDYENEQSALGFKEKHYVIEG